MAGKGRLLSSERTKKFREDRARAGATQVNVWVEKDLLARLDELKKAGNYKSRSEVVSLAVHQLVDTTKN